MNEWGSLGYPEQGQKVDASRESTATNAPAPVEMSADERTKSASSQAAEALLLAHARYEIVNGTEGRVYAVERTRRSVAIEAKGEQFGERLAADYYAAKGKPLGGSAISDALRTLRGQAQDLPVTPVFLRTAQHEGAIVVDLGGADCRGVVVTSHGWKIVDEPPVLFRRNGLGLPFPEPIAGGKIEDLHAFLNIDKERFRLLVGWLLSTFMVDAPQTVLTLHGQQGTAKSTAAELLLRLVDPNEASTQSQPKSVEDWAVIARNIRAVLLDNVSRLEPWLQDVLCWSATGATFTRRARYSDDGLAAIRVKLPIVISTIDPGQIQGDLADRMMAVELDPIPEHDKREKTEVLADFVSQHAALFGSLLDLLSKVLAVWPDVTPPGNHRMIELTHVLAALDQVKGWNTVADFATSADDVSRDVVEADSFAAALIALLDSSGTFEGTCADLLSSLDDGKSHPGQPKTAKGVQSKLKRLAPALAKVGVEVLKLPRSNRGTVYSIYRAEEADGSDMRHHCTVCKALLSPTLVNIGSTTHPNCNSEEEPF